MKTVALDVERGHLLPALAAVGKAVARRNTIPILGHLRLKVEGGRLSLTGTDLDVELTTTIDCRGAACDFTLPAGLLHDVVRKLPEGASIRITGDDKMAQIAAGRSNFKLPVLPSADFPVFNEVGYASRFTLAAPTLAKMFDATAFAMSTEETRYYLNGVYWHATADHLIAVATDGHRLAKFPTALPEGAAGQPNVILPRRTVALLQQMQPEKGDIGIEVADTRVRFALGDVTLTSKLIDGSYPDYQRVVPTDFRRSFTFDRAGLIDAIDRVATVSSERGSAVRFAFAEDLLKLSVHSPDNGSAEEEMAPADASGEPIEIGFNGRYALDLLGAAETDSVCFELGEAGAPARVRPVGAEEPAPLFVLMPMRV